jgi:hypothetical protein
MNYSVARKAGMVALMVLLPLSLVHAEGLKGINKIFVDKMDNDLDQYIRAEITKQFKGKVLVVLKQEDADAIMAGVSESQNGTRAMITGRYLGLHDTASGSISLLDKEGKVILWSAEAGDRNLFFGALSRSGPRKVADRLVSDLKKAMDEVNKGK